ncbi:MAG: preprotein translocase subunit SecE [Bacillota bacterium]
MRFLRKYWRFLREVRAELRKVVWPDANQTAIYTSVVLFTVAVVATIIWGADTVYSAGIRLIIVR